MYYDLNWNICYIFGLRNVLGNVVWVCLFDVQLMFLFLIDLETNTVRSRINDNGSRDSGLHSSRMRMGWVTLLVGWFGLRYLWYLMEHIWYWIAPLCKGRRMKRIAARRGTPGEQWSSLAAQRRVMLLGSLWTQGFCHIQWPRWSIAVRQVESCGWTVGNANVAGP